MQRGDTQRRTTTRWSLLALAVAGVALALAACGRSTIDLTISEEGKINGSYVMAISDDAAAEMDLDDATLEKLWNESELEITLPGAIEQRYAQDGYTGVEHVLTDVDIEEFSQRAGTGGSADYGFVIVRQGDEFVVEGVAYVTDWSQWHPPSDAPAPDIHLSLTFPGEVLESNGTIDGNTVTWKGTYGEYKAINARAQALPSHTPTATQAADPAAGETHSAGADTSSAGISWVVWAAIGGVVLIGAGLVAWLAMRSRPRRRVMAAAAGPMPAGAYSAPSGHAQQFGPASQYNPPPAPPQYGPPPGPTQYTPPPPAPPEHQRSTEG